ncbi:LLM class flavin-dependent oxidoreductase [Ktedonospora formicarum]|uniref:FAD-binding PCMH-type domain-containing protein n=1 Tax=Ktedonospora formicarum TaxID=2778364 RepID=A0A8J3I6C3_9CHLR|nr:LLM class flavin-dependent oxidoreductase [Ktedonospora formicarum]GHO46897.1 hypothetical protein KSX_50600 [Ktedonospora formicarum]
MNYGHPIQFGINITPVSSQPETSVSLAKRSEELGYDLVIFHNNFLQPELLDTWTLLSWVAAQTKRVHLVANISNISQWSPTVLARSVASLDLLSSGRLNLALGAGTLWNEIEKDDEAVMALDEAIDIIGGVLDGGDDTPLRFNGSYYRLKGAQRGPIPAHDIPIWVSATQRQALRLIGQKAVGWLSSIESMKPEDFPSANKIIDESAHEAGRDPREIRRLVVITGNFSPSREGFLRGPSAQWVEELLPFVTNDGISTVILKSDDLATIEQFALEVAPALREAVNRELPDAFLGPEIRRAAVRAKRRVGIDYDGVPELLALAVIEPGDVSYARVKSTYMRGGSPGIVFQVKNTNEIIEALAFARLHPTVPFAVRSGGHGISGRSTNDGGIVIDLSWLNKIEVLDELTRRVRIEPGARWMDVAAALEPYGWALSSGDYGGVGVGGLATAGGVGWLVREHGLTLDHLRAVEMVLADGSVARASDDENPDLFWAVRGAGANFGIVTSFEFEVDEVGAVGWAQLVFDASDTADFLEKWGKAVERAPRDLTSFLIMGPPRRGMAVVAQVMAVVDSDQPDIIIDRLQPLANIAPLYDQNIVITSYANIMANAHDEGYHKGQGEPVGRTGLIKHITPEFAAEAARLIYSGAVYFFQIRAVGGAVSDVDPDATAYANRAANFSVTAFGMSRHRMNTLWDALSAHFQGLYLSFETDLRPERLNDAFPPRTLARLRELKSRYDPENVFRDNFNIAPNRVSANTV